MVTTDAVGRFEVSISSPAPYTVTVVAQGFAPLDFDVRINPGQKITYRGALQPFRP